MGLVPELPNARASPATRSQAIISSIPTINAPHAQSPPVSGREVRFLVRKLIVAMGGRSGHKGGRAPIRSGRRWRTARPGVGDALRGSPRKTLRYDEYRITLPTSYLSSRQKKGPELAVHHCTNIGMTTWT